MLNLTIVWHDLCVCKRWSSWTLTTLLTGHLIRHTLRVSETKLYSDCDALANNETSHAVTP